MKALEILNNDNIFDERYLSESRYLKDDIREAIEELQEMQNRTCENCRHYKQSSTQIYKTCYANKVNGFNLESDIDFSCNKWEIRDEK